MFVMYLKNRFRGLRQRLRKAGSKVKRALFDVGLGIRFFVMGIVPTIAAASSRSNPKRQRRHHFGQGLTTTQSVGWMLAWNIFHLRPLAVVFVHGEDMPEDAEAWVARARRFLGGTFIIHQDRGRTQSSLVGFETWSLTRGRLHQEIIRLFPDHDAILLDAREPLPDVVSLVALKYAAFCFPRHERIGIVAPARVDEAGDRWAGIDYDRVKQVWVAPRLSEVRDYGQFDVPRFVLSEQVHGLYLTANYIHALPGLPDDLGDWNDIAASWIADGWQAGSRTLVYPGALIETRHPYLPPLSRAAGWQDTRVVRNRDGRVRVIFVLPATTLSGGIRAVLEKGDGLARRGFDVEIWAIGGQPDWTEVDLRVVEFRDYASLLDALTPERAIKVATWWETAQVVWLATVNHGIPVDYVQEFESWFYPGDPGAQAAVVSSYRREFAYTTTAEYQQSELAEIGIEADIIPPAFDDRVFRHRADVSRVDDTLLALGRSFFQKNFALTLTAWRSLGDARPQLALFGIEPRLVKDSRITYTVRPSDEEVALLYSSATAFIQTSLHEGFSLPIVEAMASGCPVITTDSHGNGFCVDGVNCLVVEQNNAADVAAAITRVMSDPQLRARLSAAGIETAARFTWPLVLEQSHRFYESLADAAR